MDFLVTPEFLTTYESLTDEQAACVDLAVERVIGSPGSTWARRNRVVGEDGAAWLVELWCDGDGFALYWNQSVEGTIVLLLLIGDRAAPK